MPRIVPAGQFKKLSGMKSGSRAGLQFPEIVDLSASSLSPHRIAFYLQDLASEFHVYYNRNKILTGKNELTSAKLFMISCIQTVLRNGLSLLGISAPRRM